MLSAAGDFLFALRVFLELCDQTLIRVVRAFRQMGKRLLTKGTGSAVPYIGHANDGFSR
jgi:hypothetical protein